MFSDPEKVVDQCGIQAGMEIADFGCGPGSYSIAASRSLISTGRVYAIDVQKDLLSKLKNHAAKQGLYNIEVIWGDVDNLKGSKLRDASVDLVFLCNVLFQLEDRPTAVKEVTRVLKPGGRVCVVDWTDSFGGIGPHAKMVVTKDMAVSLFEKEGFHVDRELTAGSHHYGVILKKL